MEVLPGKQHILKTDGLTKPSREANKGLQIPESLPFGDRSERELADPVERNDT